LSRRCAASDAGTEYGARSARSRDHSGKTYFGDNEDKEEEISGEEGKIFEGKVFEGKILKGKIFKEETAGAEGRSKETLGGHHRTGCAEPIGSREQKAASVLAAFSRSRAAGDCLDTRPKRAVHGLRSRWSSMIFGEAQGGAKPCAW
jgi:hypothetical protein